MKNTTVAKIQSKLNAQKDAIARIKASIRRLDKDEKATIKSLDRSITTIETKKVLMDKLEHIDLTKKSLERSLAARKGIITKLQKELVAAKQDAEKEAEETRWLLTIEKAQAQMDARNAGRPTDKQRIAAATFRKEEKSLRDARREEITEVFLAMPISYEDEQEMLAEQKAASIERKHEKKLAEITKAIEATDLTSEKEKILAIFEMVKDDPSILYNTAVVEENFSDPTIRAKVMPILVAACPASNKQEYYSMLGYGIDNAIPTSMVLALTNPRGKTIAARTEDLIASLQLLKRMFVNPFEPLNMLRQSKAVQTVGWSLGAYRIGIKPNTVTGKEINFDLNLSIAYPEPGAADEQKAAFYSLLGEIKIAAAKKIALGGVTAGSKHYDFGYISNSGLKEGSLYAFSDKEDMSCFRLGLSAEDFNAHGGILATKYQQLLARFFTPAMPSANFTSDGKSIRISEVWVTPTASVTKKGNVRKCFLGTDGKSYEVEDEDDAIIEDKPFDGQGQHRKSVFNKEMQIRPLKGLSVPCPDADFEDCIGRMRSAFKQDAEYTDLRSAGYKMIVNSTLVKEIAFFDTHEAWVKAYENAGLDEIWVHDIGHTPAVKQRKLSRQMMQTLFDITSEELLKLNGITAAELRFLNSVEGLSDLLCEVDRPFHLRSEIAKCCTEIEGLAYTAPMIQYAVDKYYGKLQDALAGKATVRGAYLFAISDPKAQREMEWEGKPYSADIGMLKAGECATGCFGNNDLCTNRSPHINHEWTYLHNVGNIYGLTGIVVNIHDFTARILALDFDGDHLLVIDDPLLVSIVKRTWTKYGLRPLMFEALKSTASTTVPSTVEDFADWVAEMIVTCEKYNLVGTYSKKANAFWNMLDISGMTMEQIQEKLKDIARIATAVNWAVDSAKTYALVFLPKNLAETYGKGIFSDRYMYGRTDEFAALMSGSITGEEAETLKAKIHEEYDNSEKYMPKGNGVVDRTISAIAKMLRGAMKYNASGMEKNTMNWLDQRPVAGSSVNVGIKKKPLAADGKLAKLMLNYFSVKGRENSVLAEKIANNEALGAYEVFELLYRAKATLMTEWCSSNVHDADEARRNKALTGKVVDEMIMDIIVEWVEPSSPKNVEKAVEWTRNEKIAAFANAILSAMVSRNGEGFSRSAFAVQTAYRMFGAIYRANYRANVAAAVKEEEQYAGMSVVEIMSEKFGYDEMVEDEFGIEFDD